MKYPRNSYRWQIIRGFTVGLHGGMVYAGSVRTYDRAATAIIDKPRKVSMPVINLPTHQRRLPRNAMAQEYRLFNLTLAPRYNDRQIDSGYDVSPNISRVPVREQLVESDVKVPLLQSLITGGFTAVSSGMVSGLLDSIATNITAYPWLNEILWFHHAGIGLVIGILSANGQWRKLLTMNRALLWAIETLTNEDIDQDGQIGEPERFKPRAIPKNTRQGTDFVDMSTNDHDDGFTRRELEAAAVAILVHGAKVSRRGLQDATANSPHSIIKLSQSQANDMANSLHEEHMAENNNILESGWDYLYQFVPEHIPAPPPSF